MILGRIDPADAAAMMAYYASYRGPIYAGLCFDDPYTVSDPLSVEVLGAAYRRMLLVLTQSDAALQNANMLQWALAPLSRVSGIAGWDAPFNGRPRFYTPLPEVVPFPAGGIYQHPALDLALALGM